MENDLAAAMSDADSVSGASEGSIGSTTSSPAAGDMGGDCAANKGIGDSSSSRGCKPRVQLPASCGPPRAGMPTVALIWIVFGGTGHIGRSVVKSALAHGDHVVMVGRTFETTPAAMLAMATAATEHAAGAGGATGAASSCLGLLCDVRSRDSVNRVVRRTLERFGRIDVIANCSGYGVVGACEDQDEYELRNQFETNFMGTLHIMQATLPVLRQQHEQDQKKREQREQRERREQSQQSQHRHRHTQPGGRYLIFSSTSGALGVPGLGPYCASKYAVEGLIEAMQYEVDPFSIKATLVEPGYVRRDDHYQPQQVGAAGSGRSATVASNPLPTWGHFLIKPPSEPYANASSPALHATRLVQWLGDRQPTSVVQCAELVWQLAHCAFPPLRLLLGSYAIESIRDRLRSVTEELEDWKHLNFPVPSDAAPATTTAMTDGADGEGGGPERKAAEKDADTKARADSGATSAMGAADQDEDMDDTE
ncbi:short chain dehydrogenase reductase [Grosmannia clavigera kw1407]|uniref:Short chain dehydrogenase reductase n=1 Tax=Grosmannia clavigera (strain kw1407 / UAMH 11150) TaxID=655863 RepID=F0XPR2_GROCL|nr:short chain dehydrogenase reductase [Grosmannia clavigera kw1407]EFX00652.1 short chain dehydrogenase reductase [Grosmannia clavigera kw1407]